MKVEAPERIWIESEGECPYFYLEEELADVAPPITEYVRADKIEAMRREIERDEALLRQVMEVLGSAHQTAMEQAMKARIPECGEFAGIAQDLDFVVAALLDWVAKQPAPQQPAAVNEAKETDYCHEIDHGTAEDRTGS